MDETLKKKESSTGSNYLKIKKIKNGASKMNKQTY